MGEFLFPMVKSSLPDEILKAWQRSPLFGQDGSQNNPPTSELDFLMRFLKTEIDNEEQRNLARAGFGLDSKGNSKTQRKRDFAQTEEVATAAGLFSGTASPSRPNCIFCDKGHASQDCYKAQKMTVEERKSAVQKKGACFTCLKTGHTAKSKKCKPAPRCPICTKRHFLLFCSQLTAKKTPAADVPVILDMLNCTAEVLLQTILVKVTNPSNQRSEVIRVLLDSGSQRSYILETAAKEMGLESQGTEVVDHSLFGGKLVTGITHQVYEVTLGSINGNFTISALLLDQ